MTAIGLITWTTFDRCADQPPGAGEDVSERYGAALTKVASMGVSAMMHGYLAFDKEGISSACSGTWRNTTTEEAARLLSEKFNFNLPSALERRASLPGDAQ